METPIKNSSALGTTPLRSDALAITAAGYNAIDTREVLHSSVKLDGDVLTVMEHTYTLRPGQGVWVVGAGKCAIAGAAALEDILGDRIAGGAIVDVADTTHRLPLKRIVSFLGTHPRPSDKNVDAAKHIVETLKPLNADDVVIALVSGGGSTLLCLPQESSTCVIEAAVFDELTASGASIQEMNTVRKHLSYARGGWLARTAYPAKLIGLIFSDVPGNDLSSIASGPTVKDTSTVESVQEIIQKYDVQALAGVTLLETPKEERYFTNVYNALLVTNDRALQAMAHSAESLGYSARIVTDRFSGEVRDIATQVIHDLKSAPSGTVLLYGGESTVMLGNHAGKGGRNQELALATLADIRDDEIIISFASDGHDNTDYAGALCDSITKAHAEEHALVPSEYLDAHRSYEFFAQTGDALITGYTSANVSDLIIACKARSQNNK